MTISISNEEIIAHQFGSAEKIKAAFLKNKIQFELLQSEIINCARHVKIWLSIAGSRENFRRLKYESFFGWVQYSTFRSIVIDGLKISQDSRGFLISILDEILLKDDAVELIKNSGIQDRINKLNSIVFPFRTWRNKRYAHLENFHLDTISCNLKDLFLALCNVNVSLNYISHYLSNPDDLIGKEWFDCAISNSTQDVNKSFLERFLKEDPTLLNCYNMIQELNEK